MALILKGCLGEPCDGIEYTDNTRLYSVTNTGGYGSQNGVTGPANFDSYTLSLWAPNLDPSVDDPTYVIDLRADVPPIDTDEDYVWTFTLEDLNATNLLSGYWYMQALAIKDGDRYEVNAYKLFVKDLRCMVDQAMLDAKIDCDCNGANPFRYQEMLNWIDPCGHSGCNNVCSMDKVKVIVAYLYEKLPTCPC